MYIDPVVYRNWKFVAVSTIENPIMLPYLYPAAGPLISLTGSDLRLKILDHRLYPNRNLLEEEFRTMCGRAARWGVENSDNDLLDSQRYKIVDVDDTEITVSQLIDKYLSNPESCFIKGYPEFSDDNSNSNGNSDKNENGNGNDSQQEEG
jgi:hypothetical protein